MTYSRLRDVLNLLNKDDLNQEAYFLIRGKLERIDYIDSFHGNNDMAKQYNTTPYQIFITNNKEL